MPKNYTVIIEDSAQSKPRPHELKAANLLAEHFKSNIIFLRTLSSKTPDLYVVKSNLRWELKSPEGKGKHTIQNNLRIASKQSENIILDLHRCGLTDSQGKSRANEFIRSEHNTIKRLKIITKSDIIIDILN